MIRDSLVSPLARRGLQTPGFLVAGARELGFMSVKNRLKILSVLLRTPVS